MIKWAYVMNIDLEILSMFYSTISSIGHKKTPRIFYVKFHLWEYL